MGEVGKSPCTVEGRTFTQGMDILRCERRRWTKSRERQPGADKPRKHLEHDLEIAKSWSIVVNSGEARDVRR